MAPICTNTNYLTHLSVFHPILIKSACSAGQATSKRGDYGHFTSWARPLLEEFLPLPAEVRDFHRDVEDLRTREPYLLLSTTLERALNPSSTAQSGGGSFKNRKPIGEAEAGCCESWMP